MHQCAGDEAGSLVIRPCKQDTDQECRKYLGRINMENTEKGLKAESPLSGCTAVAMLW